ncbi:MAG: stress responsive protein [Kiritimatiellaceae bacterium]|nr:stress responsive protein [Kiritimatiellaceae bacterium]RZO88073.1 MAG: Dabb family protein [Kiritimatiellaceae bacterium]|tara:strand:+ start:3828 stop:4133 length:306 start_codon:yes stop_codon:yes gene_type:complete
MYKHVVLWKLKDEAEGVTKAELAVEVKRRLDELPGIIPEISAYEVAINVGEYGASFFDVSLIASYLDEEAFKKYCVYPEHDAVVAFIQSVCVAEEIVDYFV